MNELVLKKYIEKFDLKEVKHSFNESLLEEKLWIEWLYFKHEGKIYCISCDYFKDKKGHKFVLSKFDAEYREIFLYHGFHEEELIEELKNIIKK